MILVCSVGFDILYIVLTRWMLRRASEMTRIPEMVGIIIADCVLGAALVYIPAGLMGVTPIRFARRSCRTTESTKSSKTMRLRVEAEGAVWAASGGWAEGVES